MRSNKGVTLITLIITIVVIIILATTAIYYGLSQNTEKAIETKTVYEVYSLVDAIANRTLLNRLNPSFYNFVGNNSFGTYTLDENGQTQIYSSSDGWYLVSSKQELQELGLDNVVGEYLINYEKGLVVSTTGIMYKGAMYYSLNDLRREMGGGTAVLSKVEYDYGKKVNKPVLSNGMVPVKLSGSKWVVTSSDDTSWYDYSADQMAWANVMLKDELAVEGFSNEEVRNKPLSDLVGREVTNEGSSYVWIPRYTATSLGETGSKIIFSNLTKDTYSANGETYILPESFKYIEAGETIELPGIWVSKYEASFDR